MNKSVENMTLIVTNGNEITDLIKFLVKFNIRSRGEIQIPLPDAHSRRGRADWRDHDQPSCSSPLLLARLLLSTIDCNPCQYPHFVPNSLKNVTQPKIYMKAPIKQRRGSKHRLTKWTHRLSPRKISPDSILPKGQNDLHHRASQQGAPQEYEQ